MNLKRGFSLLEMLVSLAVLVIALLVVSNIFALTADTARSSVAISQVQSRMRDFLATLEKDLAGINPAESILILSGGTQAAARSSEQLEAEQFSRVLVGDPDAVPNSFDPVFSNAVDPRDDQYSDPRIDILAFITNRPLQSRSPATDDIAGSGPTERFQRAVQSGGRFAPNLVVYGHAAFDVPEDGAWPPTGNEVHAINLPAARDELSPLPLTQWHLARRATILEPRFFPGTTPNPTLGSVVPPIGGSGEVQGRLEFLRCEPTVDRAGDTAKWWVEGLLDVFTAGGWEVAALPAAAGKPYEFPYGSGWAAVHGDYIRQMLYLQDGEHPRRHMATIFRNPPPNLAGNLALQGLPGCAWFQVEFLLPEDPRNSFISPNADWRDDQLRWVEIVPGSTYVFVPDNAANRAAILAQSAPGPFGLNPVPNSHLDGFGLVTRPGAATPSLGDNAENRLVRTWPYAIRITVRAYDPDGVLPNPVVRSLVHRFR